jgi:hypothetical protein
MVDTLNVLTLVVYTSKDIKLLYYVLVNTPDRISVQN